MEIFKSTSTRLICILTINIEIGEENSLGMELKVKSDPNIGI